MANKRIDEPTGVETVGHEWDGIEELNNPLPRWWVISTYLTIIFAIGYMVVYPA
ncbi:MAG: cytochrome-c oxidase, cbb3-type subunit, partial [Pseudomonadota bacterium]